jgi:hypothetical protein
MKYPVQALSNAEVRGNQGDAFTADRPGYGFEVDGPTCGARPPGLRPGTATFII